MVTYVEDIAVSGEMIAQLGDKSFTLLKSHYEERPDMDHPEIMKRKLIMHVRISTKQELDYYPNKTSVRTMMEMFGADMDKWLGIKFKWKISEQNVRGEMRKVLFVVRERTEHDPSALDEEDEARADVHRKYNGGVNVGITY